MLSQYLPDPPNWLEALTGLRYYLGDNDPSGLDIARSTEARLREFAPEVDLIFERIAVTEEQIEEFELETRPTKSTDTRAKNWEGESVEVDAIPPEALRDIVRDCIEGHVDPHALEIVKVAEESERQLVANFASQLNGESAL